MSAHVLNADCPVCAILHDGAPATILRRGIHSLVIRPLGPVTEGHVIAIPYLSLIHISEPTRRLRGSRMPSSA